MKCMICKVEVRDPMHNQAAGLTICTNADEGIPIAPEDFVAIFGLWSQRRQRRIEICSGCIVELILTATARQ